MTIVLGLKNYSNKTEIRKGEIIMIREAKDVAEFQEHLEEGKMAVQVGDNWTALLYKEEDKIFVRIVELNKEYSEHSEADFDEFISKIDADGIWGIPSLVDDDKENIEQHVSSVSRMMKLTHKIFEGGK